MIKTDKSKHNICLAAIKRHTMKPYDFKWTTFYDFNTNFPYSGLQLNLMENEIIICSTIIDSCNYSVLTTQRLITTQDGQEVIGNIEGAIHKTYGHFKKEREGKLFTFGKIQLQNGDELKYFIETGKASMIMISGISTLITITQQ